MARDSTSASGKASAKKKKKKSLDRRDNLTLNRRVYNNIEQFILMNNLDSIDRFYSEQQAEGAFNYYTFRQVNGAADKIINRLRGVDNIDVFYNIKTSTLSLMQPKVRIYKVTHETFNYNADGTVDQGSVRPLPVPIYREFAFSDNFGIETAISATEYLKYESSKPSFRNVGFESFNITQNGENHGAIENNIECELTLSFKSLKDLTASPPSEPSLRYVDLILWPPARFSKDTEQINPKHYEIKVLLGYTAPSKQELRKLGLPESEVRAISEIEKLNQIISLGLYDYDINIQDDGSVRLAARYRGRLETVVGTTQVNVFQNAYQATSTSRADIKRNVNKNNNLAHMYKLASQIKAIHNALRTAGCSGECSEKNDLVSLAEKDPAFSQQLKEVIKKAASRSAAGLKNATVDGAPGVKVLRGQEQKFYDWFKSESNVERLLANIKKTVGLYEQQLYESFMDQLIAGSDRDIDMYKSRFFVATAGKAVLEAATGAIEDTDEDGFTNISTEDVEEINLSEAQTMVDSITSALGRGEFQFRATRGLPNETVADYASELEEATGVEGAAKESASKSDAGGESERQPDKANVPIWVKKLAGNDEHRFYFLFIGDIIELACKNAGFGALKFSDINKLSTKSIYPPGQYVVTHEMDNTRDYPLSGARLLLGPIEYTSADGRNKSINLARFPVSFNNFKNWFIKKIVRKRRAQMPFGAFISDLINDLVMPSLGAGMPKSFRTAGSRASITSVTLPGDIATGDLATGKPFDELMPMKRIIDTDSPAFTSTYFDRVKSAFSRDSESLIKTSVDYMLVYVAASSDIVSRKGQPLADIKDGIYHFNIGSDQGLLTRMDFSRVTFNQLAELRSEQAEEQGVDQLEQLKFPYNTDVYLVGTSLFIPGMFYYVNPSLLGLGSVEDAASLSYQLNLGGYHLVDRVSTNISPGEFVTKVAGTQVQQGSR
tara:strand:- start:1076 stop:3925 length:2850 start_codon:yes stop_codon:yes gene_type:complete